MSENYFQKLYDINCNEHTEKKNGLTYLSWAWAWAEVKKAHPDAFYTVYENDSGWFYHSDGNTCWVKTGVTINGIEHVEYLPVMDFKNRSIPLANVTSFDVNKAIQRSLTKACARHGLGLYIYAGEDLPEEDVPKATKKSVDKTAGDVGSNIVDKAKKHVMFGYAQKLYGRDGGNAVLKKLLQKYGLDNTDGLTEDVYERVMSDLKKASEEQAS